MLINNVKRFSKRLPLTLTIASFSLMSAQAALAQDTVTRHPVQAATADVVKAIQELQNTTVSIALAGQRSANQIANAVDKELSGIIQVNTDESDIDAQQASLAAQNLQTTIHDNLAQVPNNMLTYSSNTDPNVETSQTEKNNQDNLINSLTLEIPASDTLYSLVNNIDSANAYTIYPVGKPTTLYDNYFNVNSLISPDNYNTDQQKAAQYFITYLTKDYVSLTDGINLDQLRTYLAQFNDDPVSLGQKLQSFRNSDAYKKFQVNLRATTAVKSVSLSALNDLLAERTPLRRKDPDSKLDAISKLVGFQPQQETVDDPDNPGQTVQMWTYASPLQITNYMANHRKDSPQWYQQVAAGSTQDLLRELVVIMAENESLTQQTHLDNEKILTSLATLNIQSAQANQLLGSTQIQDVNDAINAVTNVGGSSTTTPPPPPPNQTSGTTPPPTTDTTDTTVPTDSSDIPASDIPPNTDVPTTPPDTTDQTGN